MTLAPGATVSVVMTKWGGSPHWEYPGLFLGRDQYGDWAGFPVGTHYRRPGLEFVADFASVMLVPPGLGYLAAFNDANAKAAVYVDMTTPAVWDGTTLRAIDLDLDVVRRPDGTVYLDDEDEFAEHRVSYGYPADIVELAETTAADVLAAVGAGMPPFDETSGRWLAELARVAGQ